MSRNELRALLFKQQKGLCPLCGNQLPKRFLTSRSVNVDHKIPRSYGGVNSVENVALSHTRCNNYRGNDCACDAYGPEFHIPVLCRSLVARRV